MKKKAKTALITDWLDVYAGAERVLTAICEIYRFDYYYAYVNKMKPEDFVRVFGKHKVNVIEADYTKKYKSFFRYLMPFFPSLIRSFNRQTKQNTVDIVISSSWALSKGYRVGNELHICYLQARNFKYVWDEADQYFKGILRLLLFIKKPLQKFDKEAAKNPDLLIANSIFVQTWAKEKYNRDSVVIYPPVDVENFYVSAEKEGYYITVGRMAPYKRFDIIVDAFMRNGKKLIVVGDGSVLQELESKATPNIQFVGYKTQNEIKHLLSRAKGFVFAGVEDFGIAIVEALASGTPAVCYKGGASAEIINVGINGVLYDEQTASSLEEAVGRFEEMYSSFNSEAIRSNALVFSKKRFQAEFTRVIDEATKKLPQPALVERQSNFSYA